MNEIIEGDYNDGWNNAMDYCAPADRKREARIAELEKALRPFAKLGEELPTGPDWELDEKPVWSFNNAVITLGEMRLARKVLDND